MPIVGVEMWSGRDQDFKEKFAQAITEVVVEHVGCEPQAVQVILEEIPKNNWAIAGEMCTKRFPNIP